METYFNTLSTASFAAFHAILNGIWLGLLVTVPIWLFWRRSTPTNASTRYAVWWALLICVVALPFMSGSNVARLSLDGPAAQSTARLDSDVLPVSDPAAQPTTAASLTKPTSLSYNTQPSPARF
jgi:hypothetical protein